MNIANLPKDKWTAEGEQPGIKSDMLHIEMSILETHQFLQTVYPLIWLDATSAKLAATPDDIAPIMMTGFPSQLHPGKYLTGGLSDGRYRQNNADAVLDFDLPASRWGTEKTNQWYAIYAKAGAETTFVLKAMPYMRVKSQTGQVISLGTLTTPGTGIGYGFTANELAGGVIYVFSGASKGRIRAISANNDDDGAAGTITYSGDALALSQGDWFVVLPPATNFRWVMDIFNDAAGNIGHIYQNGKLVQFIDTFSCGVAGGVTEAIQLCSPIATAIGVEAVGTGFVGHLSGTAPHYGLIQLDTNDQSNFLVIPVENCKFYGANCSLYRQYYLYP